MMDDPNLTLLNAVRARREKLTRFGYGIATADQWVGNVAERIGFDRCSHLLCNRHKQVSFADAMKRASETLVYGNEEMVTDKGSIVTSGSGLDLPKNTLMAFRHVLTSSRKDRDGDVLHSDGAVLDPAMLLLWQHVHTSPIGKLIAVREKNPSRLVVVSAIVDMNELCHDSAVMVDNGMGRFSHGFRAVRFSENKEGDDGEGGGYDVREFEVMEESLVSVPANVDAEVEEVILGLAEGGKLTSPVMKEIGRGIRSKRPTQVQGVEIRYREKVGDVEREVSCGSFGELKAAVEAGLIGGKGNEDESGAGKEAGAGDGASEEAHAKAADGEGAEREEGAGDEEVRLECTKCDWKGTAKDVDEDRLCPKCGAKTREVSSEEVEDKFGRRGKHLSTKGDPIRWNKSLSKAFDVAEESLEPSSTMYDWASKFIEKPIKQLAVIETIVPSARMGTFLTGLRNALAPFKQLDLRNMDGRYESPPHYETIRLNSKLSDSFLVEGTAFMQGPEYKVLVTYRPCYFGLSLQWCCADSDRSKVQKLVDSVWLWAKENNFLRGEAFALSGEFIDKTSDVWEDVFLTPKNSGTITKTLGRLNRQKEQFANRGTMLMGPPGTGKTLSGRVLRNTADATFIWVSARDFYHAGSVGGLTFAFEMAKELSPAVIFFEDVDNWLDGYSVDILKSEMDGISRSSGVWTLLTTNFPEKMPEALIDRPGRFHDVLKFGLPDSEARKSMLERWLPDLDRSKVGEIVSLTDGYSGAHVYELCFFAKTLASEEGQPMDKAVREALRKIDEQKELINQTQSAGSDYSPRPYLRRGKSFDSAKPLPNEHRARQQDPDKYAKFRRQNDKFGDGIHAIFGITEDGKAELQSIAFDAGKFTAEEARKWLRDHDYSASGFEPAKEEDKGEDMLRTKLTDEERKRVIEAVRKIRAFSGEVDFGPPEVVDELIKSIGDRKNLAELKAGRVLNKRNLDRISGAKEHVDDVAGEKYLQRAHSAQLKQASGNLSEVLKEAERIMEEMDDEDEKPQKMTVAEASVIILSEATPEEKKALVRNLLAIDESMASAQKASMFLEFVRRASNGKHE